MANTLAELWNTTSLATLGTAKHLREREDHRSCVNRAYYAVFQAATSLCILHGDEEQFPVGWRNPSHEQLPDLIRNNGGLGVNTRRRTAKILRQLRSFREDADYRVGITVDRKRSREAVLLAVTAFELWNIEND